MRGAFDRFGIDNVMIIVRELWPRHLKRFHIDVVIVFLRLEYLVNCEDSENRLRIYVNLPRISYIILKASFFIALDNLVEH